MFIRKSFNNGFSLVEALITMGIVSGSMLAITSVINNSIQMQSLSESKSAFSQLLSWISSVVANDSSCSEALGLGNVIIYNPIPPTDYASGPFLGANGNLIAPLSTISNPSGYTASIPIVLYNKGGVVYIKSYQNSNSFSTFGSIKILKVQLLIQNPSAPLSVSGSSRVIYQTKIRISAMKAINSPSANTPMVNSDIPLNIEVDPTQGNKITSCSGFRLGNGTAVNVPKCATNQVVFANGTQFECVYSSCPATWHATSDSNDIGWKAGGTNLLPFDANLASMATRDANGNLVVKSSLGCAPGNKLGHCINVAPYAKPTSCYWSNVSGWLGSGKATGGCGDSNGNQVMSPGQPDGWYCTNPADCGTGGPTRDVTWSYCPARGGRVGVWGTPTVPASGTHTTQDCTGSGGQVVGIGNNDLTCRFNAGACPSGWVWEAKWSSTSENCTCCRTCWDACSYSHGWSNVDPAGEESCGSCAGAHCRSSSIYQVGCY